MVKNLLFCKHVNSFKEYFDIYFFVRFLLALLFTFLSYKYTIYNNLIIINIEFILNFFCHYINFTYTYSQLIYSIKNSGIEKSTPVIRFFIWLWYISCPFISYRSYRALSSKQLDYLKNKITKLSTNNGNENKDEFYEWLRGFTDAEGYFLISLNNKKNIIFDGKQVEYSTLSFSFVIHVSVKDVNVLYTIQKNLGGIGKVTINNDTATFRISSKNDLNQLLSLMYPYFSTLNTTKVLDFLDWYKAYNLYLINIVTQDVRVTKDPNFICFYNQIVAIKNNMNKARTNFNLPFFHNLNVTNIWLLGFIEGEGCFFVTNTSIKFSIAQTRVNRYVLVGIMDYLQTINPNFVLVINDYESRKGKQKPYSALYIGTTNIYYFILLLLDLPWLSFKIYSFIDWVVVYLLVSEGKHYLPEGKAILYSFKLRSGTKRLSSDNSLDKDTIDLLYSESNYLPTDQSGVVGIKKNSSGKISKFHLQGSYVLATDLNNNSLKFKSNSECAEYFEVSKVSVGRWITKNTHIQTKKGVFLFKKIID